MNVEATLAPERGATAASGRVLRWQARAWTAASVGALAMAAMALGVLATSAVFADSSSSADNAFTTGNVDLTAAPASAVLSMPSIMPGDKVTAPVTVTNSGSVQLRYSIKSTTTENVLGAGLDFTVKTGVAACDNNGFAASGTGLYGPADLGSTTGINVVGDPAAGDDTGDRVLTAGASEVLCMQVRLPAGIDSSYEGLNTTATFVFMAEQTTNNP